MNLSKNHVEKREVKYWTSDVGKSLPRIGFLDDEWYLA
jgi:hypothetical protein